MSYTQDKMQSFLKKQNRSCKIWQSTSPQKDEVISKNNENVGIM